MATLLCNSDLEMFLTGRVPSPKARPMQEAVARLFALCGPMGSDLYVVTGSQMERWPGDSLRQEAADLGLYDPSLAAAAPWCGDAQRVIAYAADDRAVELARQLGAPPDADPHVTRVVNSKEFSHRHALESGLDAGVFKYARVVSDEDTLQEILRTVPEPAARSWTLKPVLGFAGGGRVDGHGRTLDDRIRGRIRVLLARENRLLWEPWVQRIADHSVQLYVAGEGTRVLAHTRLFNTAAGRYEGNGAQDGLAPQVRSVLDAGARQAGAWLAAAGYQGPAGVDAFVYEDPLLGGSAVRPVVEINARFTLGLISSHVASMRRAKAAWRFCLDAKERFGAWR